jgi:hypothetical protein
MCNIMDNKHERNYLFVNLCGHATMDIYENNNTIKTTIDLLVINLLQN